MENLYYAVMVYALAAIGASCLLATGCLVTLLFWATRQKGIMHKGRLVTESEELS